MYCVCVCVFQIEELASTLSFSSRQASLESLASLDTVASSCSSARSSPLPRLPAPSPSASRPPSPLHPRFRVSAKKALPHCLKVQITHQTHTHTHTHTHTQV